MGSLQKLVLFAGVVAWLAASCLLTVYAAPSSSSSITIGNPVEDSLTPADVKRLQTFVLSQTLKDDLYGGSLATTYYVTRSLAILRQTIPDASKICKKASSVLTGTDSTLTLSKLTDACKIVATVCTAGVKLSAPNKDLLQKGLNSEVLSEMHAATTAISSLTSMKAPQTSADVFDWSGLSKRVMDLAEEDGTWRPDPDAEEGAGVYGGLALETIGLAAKMNPMDKVLEGHVREASNKVEALLEVGLGPADADDEHQDEVVAAAATSIDFAGTSSSSVSSIYATTAVLRGIKAIGDAVSEQINVTPNRMRRLAAFLIANKWIGVGQTATDVFDLLSGLNVVASNPVHVPFFVSLTTPSSSSSSHQIKVSNIMGNFVTAVKVTLRRASKETTTPSPPTVVENAVLTASSGQGQEATLFDLPKPLLSAWSSSTSTASGGSGWYVLRVSVDPQEKGEHVGRYDATLRLKVTGTITPSSFELFITDSPKSVAPSNSQDVFRTNYPSPLGSTVTGPVGKFVHMRVSVSGGLQPAQIFLLLTHVTTSSPAKQALFVFAPSAADASSYALKLDLGSVEVGDSLAGPGTYKAEVLFGDALTTTGLSWSIGSMHLSVTNSSQVQQQTTAHQTRWATEQQKTASEIFALKADLRHSFRAPDDRPPRPLAMLFTGLAVAPLFVLLVFLFKADLSLSLPAGGTSDLVWAMVFQASIFGLVFLYGVYWFALNIFQALTCLFFVGLVAVLSGHRALKVLHQQRRGKHKKA